MIDTAGPLKMLGVPVKMSRTPLQPQSASPGLGQHTDEVLHSLGYDAARIAELRARRCQSGPSAPDRR